MNTITLYPIDDYKDNIGIDYIEKTVYLWNLATKVNNKYAVFIPNKWYEKFAIITNLCRLQIEAYKDKIKNHNSTIQDEVCRKRTKEIKNAFDELVLELRTHINTLGIKDDNKNTD